MVILSVTLSPSLSMLQKLSPELIFLHHLPSIIGYCGLDFIANLKSLIPILTSIIFAFVFIGSGIKTLTSSKV